MRVKFAYTVSVAAAVATSTACSQESGGHGRAGAGRAAHPVGGIAYRGEDKEKGACPAARGNKIREDYTPHAHGLAGAGGDATRRVDSIERFRPAAAMPSMAYRRASGRIAPGVRSGSKKGAITLYGVGNDMQLTPGIVKT